MLLRISSFFNRHRILRGMLSYSVLWPVGCAVQQTCEGKNLTTYDWNRILRYCLYGALLQGPALYCWMRVAQMMWPRRNIRSSLAKALTEQVAFDPFSISIFMYSMTIFEGKTHDDAKKEVVDKFWSTYKIGLVYWPIAQTINFSLVPLKNQVIYVSFASLIWTSFLAYMKQQEATPTTKPATAPRPLKVASADLMDRFYSFL